MVSSVDGGGGVGEVAAPLIGDEEPCFGGDGVNGRRLVSTEGGGLRAGSIKVEGESSTDKEANADSRSLE